MAKRHIKICSALLIIRNANQNCNEIPHQPECLSSKNLQTVNAVEDEDKREPFYTVDRNVNWYSHYAEQYADSLKN